MYPKTFKYRELLSIDYIFSLTLFCIKSILVSTYLYPALQKIFVQMGDINSEISKLCWSFVILIPATNESKIFFLDLTW